MKALLKEAGQCRLVEVPEPVPGRGEVAIRVELAGICRTDLHVAAGSIASADPITLGHELCGIAGDGRRVTVDPRIAGGFLGVTRHGAFAEIVVVPATSVIEVGELEPRAAAYVEPIAAALAVPAAIADRAARVGVLGTSRFAELVALVLRAEGFDVARATGFDVGVETAGTADELAALCEAVRPGGLVLLKSRNPGAVALPMRAVVDKQLVLRGVQYGSFARAVELAGSLPLAPLFGSVMPLARWEHAFAQARASEAHKLFLAPGDPCVG